MSSNNLSKSIDDVINDITRLHRSLPPRPDIDEVEAAVALLRAVDKDEKTRIDSIRKVEEERRKSSELVPDELFVVQEQLQKNLVYFESREQKREALKLLDLENTHCTFDDLIQRAEKCLMPTEYMNLEKVDRKISSRDGRSSSDKAKALVSKPLITNEDSEKLSLIKFASLIESKSKEGIIELDMSNKLSDQVDWVPASIEKLLGLIILDLSLNQLVALPNSIGSLTTLTKLDLHSNKIRELPPTIGDLINLLTLDIRGNKMTTLPSTFSQLINLVELDVSSNKLVTLPDSIGSMTCLRKLNIEANNIEELPHTIGHCESLVELKAEYNRLKGLPEAIGRLQCLEILSVRYNNIKNLPTTMASLAKLKELDVSFNELESIPESLCLATTLVKLNLGSNFADLQALPRSIGNLEMLEELDVSNNQIKTLPDSFGMLSHLRVLRLEMNPLKIPPKHIRDMEAQVVVEYMAEFVAKKAIKLKPLKGNKSCTQFLSFSKLNRLKRKDNLNRS